MIPGIRHEIVGTAPSPHRLRIAHLSDFHLWFSDRKLRQIEDALAAWKPDVLALTGDYADTPRGQTLAADWIQRMAAAYPLCWVAGNHDRWHGKTFLHRMESLAHAYPIDRHDAWIAGKNERAYRFTAVDRMSNAAAADPAPTVVLLHNPAVIKPHALQHGGNRLLLAGHLHGGQITLWRDRLGRSQPAASCYAWLVDRTTIHAATLIVSRGLGDTLPVRLRTPREIVMVDFCA